MNWLAVLKSIGSLPPETRTKVLQLVELVAELTQDPAIIALLDSLKTA
jgi:hypothetical protein